MRRRWRPSDSTEVRVSFGKSRRILVSLADPHVHNFSSAHSRFAVPWSWSHDPAARTDPDCVRHLRKHCQQMEGALGELKPLMRRWATILPSISPSTGQSELDPDQAYQLSLYLYEHRKWLGTTVRPCFRRCFFGLVHDIGWAMETRNLGEPHEYCHVLEKAETPAVQAPDVRTVEDRFGAFEHWACVPKEGASHLPAWLQALQ